jgi:predicted PurR-regulated permease PerM
MGFLAAFVSAFATSYFTNPILRRFIRSRVPDDQDHRHPIALARRLYLASILPVFVAAIIFDLLTLSAFSDLQMNASFSQRLDALAPYIDAQTEKQFRSRWAMMGTLRDYRAISADMDQLGAKAGITLPKVLYR